MKNITKILAFLLASLLLGSCGATTPETAGEKEGTASTNAPETEAPETEAPETQAPEVDTEAETERETETETETETEAPVIEDTAVFTKRQSVLLVGQSNMVGCGKADAVAPITDDRIFMMRNDGWVPMKEPIHANATANTVGPAASFAKAFVETFDCELGLIPAAVGGSAASRWLKSYTGDDGHYAPAIEMARKAQETTEICAILWHQGESNRGNKNYADLVKQIIDSMIEDLGLDRDKIVIITGEIGAWEGKEVTLVNSALAAIEAENYYPNYAFVSQEGLTNIERVSTDSHFDSPSVRVMGYRYFEAFYEELLDRECPYEYSQNTDDYRINK